MTVEEFLLTHPDEDVDLQVPEVRISLVHREGLPAFALFPFHRAPAFRALS